MMGALAAVIGGVATLLVLAAVALKGPRSDDLITHEDLEQMNAIRRPEPTGSPYEEGA